MGITPVPVRISAGHVRFIPKSSILRMRRRSPAQRAPCADGSQVGKGSLFTGSCSIGRCSHVFGLLARFA